MSALVRIAVQSWARQLAGLTLLGFALAGCAAPPLRLYTLTEPSLSTDAHPLQPGALVIEVTRVSLPDYLDTQDILIRRGNVLERSSTARWASRLSLGATELLTTRLAMSRPDALVTNEPPMRTPDYQILIHISQLDIMSTGTGVVEADWQIIRLDGTQPILRERTRFSVAGSVATDQSLTSFERTLFNRLAGAIDLSQLARSAGEPRPTAVR